MNDPDDHSSELRQQAENVLRARHADPLKLTPDQLPALIHELEVHQIELEMQNEELHRSSVELEAARDRYADLFDLAPVGYLILNASGRVLRANLAGAELLGLTRPQILGSELFNFIDKEHQDTLFRHLRQVLKSQTRQGCEVQMVRADGTRFFAKLDSIAQPDIAKDSSDCLILISDITELKLAEAVSRQAMGAAEKANQAKTRFLAAASHDLRQPLQAITTIGDILKRKLDNEATLKLVDNLSKCVFDMTELFNVLLDISQLESGSITPNIKEFPVHELLKRVDTLYRPLAEKKGLRLHLVQSSATIRSDPILLGQILDNLVSNAIRYTDTGKVLVGCRRRGTTLRIEVWDTGIGIPENQHKLIFDDFYQLGNSARDRSKGLGLGLATATRSARLMGEQIELKSWQNGTLFSITAPLVLEEPVPERAPVSGGIEEQTPQAISLLLVEDNRVVLFMLTHLLENYGYDVTGAMDAPEALAKLREALKPFDFIVTDYRLPNGETGIELIKTIRLTLGSEIPALIITGDLAVTSMQDVVESGLTVLEKPVQVEVLNQHIKEILA